MLFIPNKQTLVHSERAIKDFLKLILKSLSDYAHLERKPKIF